MFITNLSRVWRKPVLTLRNSVFRVPLQHGPRNNISQNIPETTLRFERKSQECSEKDTRSAVTAKMSSGNAKTKTYYKPPYVFNTKGRASPELNAGCALCRVFETRLSELPEPWPTLAPTRKNNYISFKLKKYKLIFWLRRAKKSLYFLLASKKSLYFF